MTFEQLMKQVAKLEKEVQAFKSTTTISKEQENALRHRLKVLTAASNATSTFTQANIRRDINLTGNAQTISVLEDPAGYIPVRFQNATYKIPYWVE